MLLKQDKIEAVLAVDGRLEYIENEMYALPLTSKFGEMLILGSKRVEKQIKDTEDESDAVRAQVSYFLDFLLRWVVEANGE